VLAWALLAGLIQARLVAGWRGRRLALLVVAGFLLLVGTYAGLLAAPQHAPAAAAALIAPGRD
jgi:ABC-type transport system involved in cytochrome c biogenesis permease subunit